MTKDVEPKKLTKKERWPYTVNTYNDMLAHPTASYRKVATAILEHQPVSCPDISAECELTESTVNNVIRFMRQHRLIYISEWVVTTPSSRLASYSVGDQPDAERPERKFKYAPTPKVATPLKFAKAGLADMKEVAAALVPQRNVLEQAEVNRLYVNWIGNGIYD